MKKTANLVGKLIDLASGEALPEGQLRGEWFRQMQADGILIAITHGSRKSWRAISEQSLRRYVAEKYGIRDLEECKAMLDGETISRSGMVEATGDSKFVMKRSFTGFMVNSYVPIAASINGSEFTIAPADGTFTFIYDYRSFSIPKDVIVVGIENAENFRHISSQRCFFEREISAHAPLLFVSRYPQNGDLARWLQQIPNRYVHFGDLDLAGIHIYLAEIYQYIGERSEFLIPSDSEQRLSKGSRQRYDYQYARYHGMAIADPRCQALADLINHHHRGYDQEGFIHG